MFSVYLNLANKFENIAFNFVAKIHYIFYFYIVFINKLFCSISFCPRLLLFFLDRNISGNAQLNISYSEKILINNFSFLILC